MSSIVLLQRRRMMMGGGKSSILPDGYTPLEYIQGTGSKSIVLTKINAGDSIVFDAVEVLPASVRMLLSHSPNAGGWVGILDTGKWGTGGADSAHLTIDCTERIKCTTTFNGNGIVVEANGETCSRSGNMAISNKSLYLFGSNNNYCSKAKVYNLQQYRDSEMIANFIPCTETATSKTGFYDVINDTFIEY